MRTTILLTTWLALVGGSASADLRPLTRVDLATPTRQRAEQLTTQAAYALSRGDHAGALTFADQAIAVDPADGWAHYDRAAALSSLGRVDEAIASYRLAEREFGDADPWARSLAVYG